jgi:hypothetical protein
MRSATREDLLKAIERGAEVIETRSNQPVKYQPRSDSDRKPWTVYEPVVRTTYRLADDEVSIVGTDLTPVSAFDDALDKARNAARAMFPLVAETLHRQFPGGAYLVLTRSTGDYDDEPLELDSVRDVQGEIVRAFNPYALASDRLPNVPEGLAELWGDLDPRKPEQILILLRRIDDLVEPFEFLPKKAMRGDEENAEHTPLGLPLAEPDRPQCAVCQTPITEHAGICPRP